MLHLRTLGTLEMLDGGGTVVSTRPKVLALLAYLLVEGSTGGVSRDTLQALFWRDHSSDRAQHALRQLLYTLRRDAGSELVLRGSRGMVAVDRNLVHCDALAFREAIAAGKVNEACSLYRGDFLAGAHLRDAPEWERWMDGVGETLRRQALKAADEAVLAARERGDLEHAVTLSRWRTRLAPFEEVGHQRLMELLVLNGDRSAALHAYQGFERFLREELGTEPSDATRALLATFRNGESEAVTSPPNVDLDPVPAAPPPVTRSPSPDPLLPPDAVATSHRSPRVAWLAAAAMVAIVGVLPRLVGGVDEPPPPAILAVTSITDFRDDASGGQGWGVEEILAAALDGVPGLHLVGTDHLSELAPLASDGSEDRMEAARRAGATLALEGELRGTDGREVHLDLRTVEPGSGTVVGEWRLRGTDARSVLTRAVREVALSLNAPASPGSTPPSSSETALRVYREGLRALHDGDLPGARTLLSAALAEDSTLAMAAFHLSRSWPTSQISRMHLERARDLSTHASDRDRLRIQTAWALINTEPAAVELATRLVTRYPHEPDGALFLGHALHIDGRYDEAVVWLEAVVASDTLGLAGIIRECRGCDALHRLLETHLAMGDGAGAERWARRTVEERPTSARSWRDLAWVLWRLGHYSEALEARTRATELQPAVADDLVFPALVHLRSGAFDDGEAHLGELARTGASEILTTVLWGQVYFDRERGRKEEAVARAEELRRVWDARSPETPMASVHTLQAVVLMEAGEWVRSAALFDSIRASAVAGAASETHALRQTIWYSTHAAHARAMAGDTVGLAALADTLRVHGLRSGYVRDRRLHHHLRGLLMEARGNLAEAEREYRAAHYSRWFNYVLSSYRLAEVLLAQGKAAEAVAVVEDALMGPTQSVGGYVPRADFHELMARALRADGREDEARAAMDYVERARGVNGSG